MVLSGGVRRVPALACTPEDRTHLRHVLLREHRGVCHDRAVERSRTAAGRGQKLISIRRILQRSCDHGDDTLGLLRVRLDHAPDFFRRDCMLIRLALTAVHVCHECEVDVMDLGFTEELVFRNRGHADEIGVVTEQRCLTAVGEPRTVDHAERGAGVDREILIISHDIPDVLAQHGTPRICALQMSGDAVSEESRRPPLGAVDEVVDEHQVTRRQPLAPAADRSRADRVGDAQLLEPVDHRTVVNLVREQAMPHTVPRGEDRLDAVQGAHRELTRRLSERCIHRNRRHVR